MRALVGEPLDVLPVRFRKAQRHCALVGRELQGGAHDGSAQLMGHLRRNHPRQRQDGQHRPLGD